MFQYAAGRALAAYHNVPLKLDIRWMRRYHWNFQLDQFPISAGISSSPDNLRYTWFPFEIHPPYHYLKYIVSFNKLVYMEKDFNYKTDFRSLGPSAFLFGYFQSEKYFMDHEPIIRKEFFHEPDLSLYKDDVLEALKEEGATSVHFRRGNYLTDKTVNRMIGVLPMEYYERAIAYMRSKKKHVRFLIFSDEIDWCRENVKIENALYVENNRGSYIDDLFIAARCENNILANSTFCWWSAWLNENPNKIVIAPERWFRNEILQKQSCDLIPKDWVRM